MNAALDVLAVLSSIGAKLEPEGDRLILRAGPEAIPAPLVRRVREAKAEILAMLLADDGGAKIVGGEADAHQPIDRAFESLIAEWLNRNPAPSAPGRCALCGRPETAEAVVLPFGTEPGTHTWLHSVCWHEWHSARRADAVAVLQPMRMRP
jgi:hypothetical protein